MKVLIRADASVQIGTGHVMRCLTLAAELARSGAECRFICRELPGHLIAAIRRQGFVVHCLPSPLADEAPGPGMGLAHAAWLGVTQEQDARECAALIEQTRPDLLLVDHYALDARWESLLRPHVHKLIVIDDLADRAHQCDWLLDQNLAREAADYLAWVPANCKLLCGSQFALLRPEFATLRSQSLLERRAVRPRNLLISMGGVDKDNVTGKVLAALARLDLGEVAHITVVMGATAPWLDEVRRLAKGMPRPTSVRVGVENMAQLMADSALAIGAAGATSWERCCLGVPSVMLVLAENQLGSAQALHRSGAAVLATVEMLKTSTLVTDLLRDPQALLRMSESAAAIADGLGALRVVTALAE